MFEEVRSAQNFSGGLSWRGRHIRRAGAVIAVTAMTAAGSLFGAHSASAAPPPVSQSEGRFLSGSVLGASLDNLLSVQPAAAANSGGAEAVQVNPLAVSALNAVDISLGGGINLLGNNGILALGAVNQYAEAAATGSSQAASGAVTDSGAVAVGGSAGAPANASFNLQNLIGAGLAGSLSDLRLNVGALSATANQTAGGTQTGNYQVANLGLTLNSPLVAGIVTNLRTALIALQPAVNGLPALIRALPGVGPLATITGLPNLATITDALTIVTSADGSITANLQTGAVTIDVAKILTTAGLNLNNLPPNTQLLPYITAALTSQLLPALTTAVTGLVSQVTTAVNSISVSVLGIPVALAILAPVLNPVITQLVAPINSAATSLGSTVITPLATALSTILSLQGNVQENAGGTFTERALRVGLLPTAPTPAAVVNLASSSVGPNAGPAAAPTAGSLSPVSGPAAGGQTVTVTGTGFVAGQTSVTIGGNTVAAADVTVTSATSLTFATPAHAAGAVGVTVTTPAGTSAPALTYTYLAGPVALALDPTSGPITGGQTVTVAGSGFVPGQTSVTIGGNTVAAADVTVASATSLTFSTPAHAAGAVNVTVTTPAGTSTPPLVYTYVNGPILPSAPIALALNPTSGPVAGGQVVTVAGSGFVPGQTSVTIGGNTVPAAAVTVSSANSLTFSTPAHAAGAVGVTVMTPGGSSTPALVYTYVDGPILPVAPVALALTPPAGPVAGGQTVAVTGLGFIPGSTSVTIGGNTVPAAAVTVLTPVSLTFSTPAHVAGAVNVTVTTPGGTSTPALVYTYVDGPIVPVPPVALLLSPPAGPVTGGQTVTVTGLGFVPGQTSVTIGGNTVPAAEVTVSSPLTLTFSTPAHAAGPVDVTVTTPAGTSTPALAYTYLDSPVLPVAPVTLALNPTSGPVAGGQTVTVAGVGFVPGQTSVTIGGNTVPAAEVTVSSPLTLTFETPAHAAGAVGVTVTTPGGTSTPALTYTYLDGPVLPVPPVALALTPPAGPVAGGQTVAVTGLGFVPGSTSVTIGGTTVPAAEVTVSSPLTLTFETPAHAAGAVDVTVTTPAGTSSPALVYTYVDGPILPVPPVALLLDPPAGPAAGGQTVTVTGLGFVPGATSVTIGGTTVPAAEVTVSSPLTLTFETPAHAAGPVGVTVTTPAGTSSPALTYTYLDGPVLPVPPLTLALSPTTGPVAGGQTVTVAGVGFVAGQTSVTIGGITVPAAEVTVSSPLTLTFETPAHAAGAVGVTVTTPAGTSSPALVYTYLDGPILPVPPVALLLSPPAGPVAGGQTVAVTGLGFVAGQTSVTIGGITVPAAAVTVLAPTSLTFTTPAHAAGAVDVTVTTPAGTSSPALVYTYLDGPILPVPPVALLLAPPAGPVAGGQMVTIAGVGFVAGQTSVTIGGITVPAAEVTVSSPLTLTFETPAHAAGPVGVTVTTPAGTSSPALVYTYVDGPILPVPPVALLLNPPAGPVAGGQTVTVTGLGFVAGDTTVTIGGSTVNAIVTSGTSLTFVTPAHAAGPVQVTVTTPSGTSPGLPYVYLPPIVVPGSPTATALSPASGPVAGGQTVTVTGTGFVPGFTSVVIDGVTIPATATSTTSLTFVTPAHSAGPVQVTVTTLFGTSDPALTYTYLAAAVAPTAAELHPVSGPVAGGQAVTVTGTGFVPGATTVTIGGKTVNATVSSPTTLTFVTPAHPAGPVQVTVTTANGTSPGSTYTYLAASVPVLPAAPVITEPVDGGTVTDPQPIISGTGTAGGTVTVHEGGTVLCTAQVGSDGAWSCRPDTALGNGKHTVFATLRTAAGLESADSATVSFTVAAEGVAGIGSQPPNLAYTGAAPLGVLVLAALLLGLGVLLATRRSAGRSTAG